MSALYFYIFHKHKKAKRDAVNTLRSCTYHEVTEK